ncbi:MAG: helix-turn-helix domain-containing protein [Pyrinomonadaceae bacterium MAG19_C2-C3]|nr:helix-turn-helix domain-containing protein [Pyrinomonadaceae bacterium MAG19_C2-C3]
MKEMPSNLMPVESLPVPKTRASSRGDVYDDGYLRVEHDNYYVACAGQPLDLPRKEFLIISRLVRNADRIVAGQELWRYAWAVKPNSGNNTLDFNAESLHVHIYRLRRKLEAHDLQIETMIGVGYRLRTRPASGMVQTDVT